MAWGGPSQSTLTLVVGMGRTWSVHAHTCGQHGEDLVSPRSHFGWHGEDLVVLARTARLMAWGGPSQSTLTIWLAWGGPSSPHSHCGRWHETVHAHTWLAWGVPSRPRAYCGRQCSPHSHCSRWHGEDLLSPHSHCGQWHGEDLFSPHSHCGRHANASTHT